MILLWLQTPTMIRSYDEWAPAKVYGHGPMPVGYIDNTTCVESLHGLDVEVTARARILAEQAVTEGTILRYMLERCAPDGAQLTREDRAALRAIAEAVFRGVPERWAERQLAASVLCS